VQTIASTYHRWREGKDYEDVPGFCRAATRDEIESHAYVLTPGRYVGAAAAEEDAVPFPERFAELQAKLEEQFADSAQLEASIRNGLTRLNIGRSM
jgi:type I restriction enzyme M protein